MKTVGLMIRLARALWSTGKEVIMDSIFFSLKGLLEMSKRGFYGSVLIKKRRYWPRGVYVYAINDYFRSKNIGNVGCLSGEWNETEFDIFALKGPDYNITMMSTFSGLTVPEGQKEEKDGEWGDSQVQIS